MISKRKVVIGLVTLLFIIIATGLTSLFSVKSEFEKYLQKRYSQLTFKIGFTQIDPIYGKFYASATCIQDGVAFPIAKDFKTEQITEDYEQYKSVIQYNSKVKAALNDSDVKSYILDVTGGGEVPFQDERSYDQINIELAKNTNQITLVRKILSILHERNIHYEKVIFTWELDGHIYELQVSSADSLLSEDDLENKEKQLK
jgi:hypothetical protein